TVADQDAEPVTLRREARLLLASYPVEHLELHFLRLQPQEPRRLFDAPDERGIVRAEDRPHARPARLGTEEAASEAEVVGVDLLLFGERLVGRLEVGALDQAQASAQRDEGLEIPLGPAQVRLHADAHVRKAGPGAAIDVECRV